MLVPSITVGFGGATTYHIINYIQYLRRKYWEALKSDDTFLSFQDDMYAGTISKCRVKMNLCGCYSNILHVYIAQALSINSKSSRLIRVPPRRPPNVAVFPSFHPSPHLLSLLPLPTSQPAELATTILPCPD